MTFPKQISFQNEWFCMELVSKLSGFYSLNIPLENTSNNLEMGGKVCTLVMKAPERAQMLSPMGHATF